jgi:ABC-type lipoprotein export system ATPase subunit
MNDPFPSSKPRPLLAGVELTRVLPGAVPTTAIQGVSVSVEGGELVAIAGPSGSGKTTLLAILGGLDRPTSGRVFLEGEEIYNFSRRALTKFRTERIGFIFQTHNLLASLTAQENVELAVRMVRGHAVDPRAAATDVLASLDLARFCHRLPIQLSLGEQQRVAVARAIAIKPRILIADEPTASLDGNNGERVLEALHAATQTGCAVIMASHDERCLRSAIRVLHLLDGRLEGASLH